MRNPFRYGNKAALIVGVLLLFLDGWPLARDFGAWPIGCLLCFWYSATAVWEDKRLNQRVKYGLLAYLVIVLLIVLSLYSTTKEPGGSHDWSFPPALKAIGFGKR